jgi:hypothetical protein
LATMTPGATGDSRGLMEATVVLARVAHREALALVGVHTDPVLRAARGRAALAAPALQDQVPRVHPVRQDPPDPAPQADPARVRAAPEMTTPASTTETFGIPRDFRTALGSSGQ